jgi:hypothetical protein
MRRMSFALTTEQIKNKNKTVTRRLGWNNLMPGTLIQPVVKCMGLKKGEKQQLIGGPIEVISASVQRLYQISQQDCEAEGFPNMNPPQFIDMFCKANKCDKNVLVNRIQFKY